MITSKKYKFIFIHIPKTAGSSLNTALETLDPESEESTRIFSAGGEFFAAANLKKTTTPYRDIRKDKKQAVYFERSTDFAHPYYPFNKLLCGERLSDPSYFSFSFVRNPFDRAVSAYTYASRRLEFEGDKKNIDPSFKFESFSEFCEKYLTNENFCDPVTRHNVHFLPQYRFLYEPQEAVLKDGVPIVSYVGRFESLQDDFDYVCEKIGAKKIKLPRVRDQKSKKDCGEYYTKESRKIVEEAYRRDLDLFNYDFPKSATKRVSLSDDCFKERPPHEIGHSQNSSKEKARAFRNELKEMWESRDKTGGFFKYANEYISESESLSSLKKGNTSLNLDSKIAIINVNTNKKYSVESENSILNYASKNNYAAHIYRERGSSIKQALINHIKNYEYILYISDSSLIANEGNKIEDLINKYKTKYIIADKGLNAILVKSHRYTENLIEKWSEIHPLKALKDSDPSGFNHKILKNPLCAELDSLRGDALVLNFSKASKSQRLFFMKTWNATHLVA